jgi:hypothetical protein
LERTAEQIETQQREHGTEIIRAKQKINEAQQKMVSIGDDRRAAAISNLKVTQGELKELGQRYQTAQRILLGAAVGSADMRNPLTRDQTPKLIFTIVRAEGAETREREAGETTTVEPGDVIKVRLATESGEQLGANSSAGANGPDLNDNAPLKQIGQGAPASASTER